MKLSIEKKGKKLMKVYARIFFFFFILTICVSLLYRLNFTDKNEKKFLCREVPEGYEVVLYGKRNEEYFSIVYPKEPEIISIADDILEISVSTGSPSRYTFYFDSKSVKISETFFNPMLIDNKYVAYMENDRLILVDIFREGILYEEIVRDFSKMADSISAVISIELLENGDFFLKYYKGDEMQIITEKIERADVKKEIPPNI